MTTPEVPTGTVRGTIGVGVVIERGRASATRTGPRARVRAAADSPRVQWLVFGLVIALGAAFLLYGARNTWFFGDDWAFIVRRRQLWADGRYAEYLLAPHNEHWVLVPVIAHGLLFRVFGLHSYLPYLVPVVACHLGICIALRSIMRRVGVGPWLATGAATLFLIFGSGAENLIWGFQLGFVLAVLLGLVQLLLADHAGVSPARDAGAAAAGCLAVMSAGVAITMVAVVVGTLLARRRWLAAAIQGGVPGLLYATWYLGYGGSRIVSPPSDVSLVPAYVGTGLSNALDQVAQLPTVGLAAGLVLLALAARGTLGPLDRVLPALTMAGGAAVLFAINGLGRATLGLEQARASRYVYIAAALLLPLLVCGLQALVATGRAGRAIAWGLLAWAIIGNVGAYFVQRDGRLELLTETRPRIEAVAGYADRSWVDPGSRPEPTYDPDVTMASLRSLVRSKDLDVPEAVPTVAALQAALDFGVAIEPSSTTGPTGGLSVIGLTDATTSPAGEGCVTLTATGPSPAVTLGGRDRGAVLVQTMGTGLGVRMVDDAGATTEQRAVEGQSVVVRVDVDAGNPVLDLPVDAFTTVCGAAFP